MKKRRLMIVSFLVCAALIMGIGYASVNGTLNITGQAEFNGKSVVSSEITKAVKFTDFQAVANCTARINGDHAAGMTVTFNDTEGTVGQVFTATAVYTIKYDTTDTTLPSVTLEKPTATMTSTAGSPGFAIDVRWGEETTTAEAKTLAPGEEIDITVIVTYTNQDPAEAGTVTSMLSVAIPFVSIDSTAAAAD